MMASEAASSPAAVKRFRAWVHGRVQGVNFRYATCEQAARLQIVGYVRNTWEPTVEVVAEGRADALEQLLSWLHRGPSMARVTRVEVQWQTPLGEFQDFEVRY